MKKCRKLIVYISLSCIILQNVFFSYSFASDNCYVCNSTPVSLQMFLDYEVEMIGILQGTPDRPNVAIKTSKRVGLFSTKFFELSRSFLSSLVSKFNRNAQTQAKALKSIEMSSIILEKMVLSNTVKDGLSSVLILFRSEPFVRDYKLLQEVDMSINDLIRDLGQKGLWSENISSETLSQIVDLQSKYTQGGQYPIFSKFQVSGNAKYRHIVSTILVLNSKMKNNLVGGIFRGYSETEASRGGQKVVIELNEEYLSKLIMEYDCGRTLSCSKSYDIIKDGLSSIEDFGTSYSNSMNDISQSFKNFKEALQNIDSLDKRWNSLTTPGDNEDTKQILTDRQRELLLTVYGIDALDLTDSQASFLKRLWLNTKIQVNKSWSDMKNGIVNEFGGDVQQFSKDMRNKNAKSNYLNSLDDDTIEAKKEKKDQELLNPNAFADEMSSDLQEIALSVLGDMSEDKKILLISINQDTHYFIEIGTIIHSIIEDKIGSKNSEGLVKNLGEACSYQCSNKGNRNCYK